MIEVLYSLPYSITHRLQELKKQNKPWETDTWMDIKGHAREIVNCGGKRRSLSCQYSLVWGASCLWKTIGKEKIEKQGHGRINECTYPTIHPHFRERTTIFTAIKV